MAPRLGSVLAITFAGLYEQRTDRRRMTPLAPALPAYRDGVPEAPD